MFQNRRSNPAVDPVRFALWTLRDEAAQRRSPLTLGFLNMPIEFKKKIYSSLLAAAFMVLILGQEHLGFMLYVVVLPLLIWIPYSAYVMVRKPDIRAQQFVRVFIWIVAIALVTGIHYIRHKTTRHSAEEIVSAIDSFSATHGHCPANLDEIGISSEQLREKLGMSGYSCDKGNPHLFYAATYIVFDTYHYDFKTGSWKYAD